MSSDRSDRPYLQHGSRHTPVTGSDPIPGITPTPQLASAYYSASVVPLTTFAAAVTRVDLDTLDTTNDPDVFDLASGNAQLAAGFYLAFVYIEFHTFADWSAKTSLVAVGFESSGAHVRTGGIATTGAPTNIADIEETDFINIGGGTETVWVNIAFSGAIASPPENIDSVLATFVRLSDGI
jgi:hypothetical protein